MVLDFVVLILNLNILVCMQTRDWLDVMQLVVLLHCNWLVVDLGHVVAIITVWCLLLKLPHNNNMGNTLFGYNNITMTPTE
jgi:hypothetical protein